METMRYRRFAHSFAARRPRFIGLSVLKEMRRHATGWGRPMRQRLQYRVQKRPVDSLSWKLDAARIGVIRYRFFQPWERRS